MRHFFKKKKKSTSSGVGIAIGSTDSGSFPTDAVTTKPKKEKQPARANKKKMVNGSSSAHQKKALSSPSHRSVRELNATLPLSPDISNDDDLDEISSLELGDIPRSISTTTSYLSSISGSRRSPQLPPPSPRTPPCDDGRNDDDSIGSPCENMRRSIIEAAKRDAGTIDISNKEEEHTDQGVECQLFKPQPRLTNISTKKLAAKLSSLSNSTTPSIQLLPEYMEALSAIHSPDPSGDLPTRALRALFVLSEHTSSHDVRVAMVRDGTAVTTNNNKRAGKLIPTLLTFLQRCPRDSSEQYLTLLVLNNLSIPMENKELVSLECGAMNVLGKMLLEDVGCHLLVIIIVNLTFCEADVRSRLLMAAPGGGAGGSSNGEEELQVIDCLAYALMLSSITTEQLSTLGPIPLRSPNGTPHTPRKLLSILRSTLATTFPNFIHNSDDNNNISPPLLLSDDENCPFPETARWCLCALKNLTRPGRKKKLSISNPPTKNDAFGFQTEELSGDAIAARAIIDAGLVPILLRVIRVAKADNCSSNTNGMGGGSFGGAAAAATCDPFVGRLPDELCNEGHGGIISSSLLNTNTIINIPSWNSNSAQDAALYTLMHMTNIPSVREDLLCMNDGVGEGGLPLVVYELKNIVDCGLDDVCGLGDRLVDVVVGDNIHKEDRKSEPLGGGLDESANLGWLSLQCVKARMSLSFLLSTDWNSGSNEALNECYNFPPNILAEHEAHTLVELLSHCIENRSKDGPGGYSAATFTLKGLLHSIKCLLKEPGNRSKFASINGARLNALLLKVVAQYALLSNEGDSDISGTVDNEAIDDAVLSLYYMSSFGFRDSVCLSTHGQSTFLPSVFGKRKSGRTSSDGLANCDAKDILVKVLTLYVGKVNTTISSAVGRHAAIQLMLRASLLRFEGEVADLTYVGKRYPSRMDFDFNDELLAEANALLIEKRTEGARPKLILFSRRQIVRYERYGSSKPKVYANPIIAAEDISLLSSSIVPSNKATIDDIAIANDIASCAEGSLQSSGESHGFTWKWKEHGCRNVIDDLESEVPTERGPSVFVGADEKHTMDGKDSSSTSRKHRGLLGKLGNLVSAYEDEPVSIFGFRCGPPKCGRVSVL